MMLLSFLLSFKSIEENYPKLEKISYSHALCFLLGFFVDVNLFKANKERAAGIGKSNNDIVGHVNNGSSTSTIDGLANEDANLMIKLKFLTYKVYSLNLFIQWASF